MSSNGTLKQIDLNTGNAQTLGPADDFAFDPLSKSILTVRYLADGSSVSIQHLNGNGARTGIIRLHIIAVHDTGVSGQFCAEIMPSTYKMGDIPFFGFYAITADFTGPATNAFRTDPMQGLSGIVSLPAAESLIFDTSSPGTFAISAGISVPAKSLATAKIQGQMQGDFYLVLYKDWKPAFAWPGHPRPIAFANDGRHMAAIMNGENRGLGGNPEFGSIDITTGQSTPLPWISPNLSDWFPFMSGDLTEAVLLMQLSNGEGMSPSPRATMDVLVKGANSWAQAHAEAKPPQWVLASMGANHDPKVLFGFADQPKITAISDGPSFLITDGEQLWVVKNGEIVNEKKIVDK